MVTKSYDIFKRLPSGPIWIQAVQGFEEARRRLVLLRAEAPAIILCTIQSGVRSWQSPSRRELLNHPVRGAFAHTEGRYNRFSNVRPSHGSLPFSAPVGNGIIHDCR